MLHQNLYKDKFPAQSSGPDHWYKKVQNQMLGDRPKEQNIKNRGAQLMCTVVLRTQMYWWIEVVPQNHM